MPPQDVWKSPSPLFSTGHRPLPCSHCTVSPPAGHRVPLTMCDPWMTSLFRCIYIQLPCIFACPFPYASTPSLTPLPVGIHNGPTNKPLYTNTTTLSRNCSATLTRRMPNRRSDHSYRQVRRSFTFSFTKTGVKLPLTLEPIQRQCAKDLNRTNSYP